MRVSLNRGPRNRPQHTMSFIIRSSKKGPLMFGTKAGLETMHVDLLSQPGVQGWQIIIVLRIMCKDSCGYDFDWDVKACMSKHKHKSPYPIAQALSGFCAHRCLTNP